MEKGKSYIESWRYKVANSKLGSAIMAVAMLPVAPLASHIGRSQAEYDQVELSRQEEIVLVSANIHNEPLIRAINFFDGTFKEADPLDIIERQKPDIACLQEISEEDALSLRAYGDVVFVSNNEYPLNGKVGIAIFSRRKINSVETPNLSLGGDQRPAIIASIDGLRVACLHLSNSNNLAQSELDRLGDISEHLDAIMGDLNLIPEESDPIIGDIGYTSRLDVPTHPKSSKVIDRIILPDESRILVYKFGGSIIEIHSDHRGVVVRIKPSNWATMDMKDFKGVSHKIRTQKMVYLG
jgi:endonuclease/exonuclease/phosphatase family metal-dependent hydrolase